MISDVTSKLDACTPNCDHGQCPNLTDPWLLHLKNMEETRTILLLKALGSLRLG